MNKTVYVLGAGFSMDAKAPSQEKLVEKIFEVHKTNPYEFSQGSVEEFKDFLISTLGIPQEMHSYIPLEDVFTPLDRCLVDNVAFRNLNTDAIKKTRRLIYLLIGNTLEFLLRNSSKEYIDLFAAHLVNEASKRMNFNYKNIDPVSVISTNWDILLDNSIKSYIDSAFYDKAVVDYCCHISSYTSADYTVRPGLEMLGMGGFNVKLLKLHGSLNWLQCPRCLRLYIDFDNKIAVSQNINKEKCRHCNENFGLQESHILESNLIMPTFLKDLTNPQYKIIWQNAGIELSEAERIIFIGYSLPQADFEMRQLLSRMVRDTAEIEVVDFGDPSSKKIADTKSRYGIFFGNRKIAFHTDGARKYIEANLRKTY